MLVQLTSKLWIVPEGIYLIYCPACSCAHRLDRYRNRFNGNLSQICFAGSIKIVGPNYMCHFNIIDNNISYFGDSTHGLRGTTIPLPDVPANYGSL